MPITTPILHEGQFRKQHKCPWCGGMYHHKGFITPICPHCGHTKHNHYY